MKKNAFTIVEFIIVMTIITIMFLLTKNYFTNESKIYYAGESCINNMFYSLKDINNAALLGRTRSLSGLFVSGGNNIQTPDRYTILLRAPSYYESPQFPIPMEGVSGMVQSLIGEPTNASVL